MRINKLIKIVNNWVLTGSLVKPAIFQPTARNQSDYDWQYLVTPGHVIFARMNHFNPVGVRIMLYILESFAWFYFAFDIAVSLLAKIGRFEKVDNARPTIHATKIQFRKI